MASNLPPPPDRPAPAARPGVVTAAGIVLIVAGALGVLAGIILLAAGGGFAVIGIIFLAVGAIEIWAGIQVLNLREAGRQAGIWLAGISLVFNIISIARAAGTGIIGLLLDAFIIWALVTNREYFHS